ncbi:MAG TPA: glutamine synthetase family protein [Candidatus Blautia intestinigallinarum]|nr:glutamine synthetase family protein [Candidatus Blautia intestinigallinarum]
MEKYTRENIEQLIEEDVEFVRLQFTDLFGTMKNVAITSENLGSALEDKIQIHASSVEGFLHEEEEDVYLKPDLSTFKILPWRPQSGKVARIICDIRQSDGTPFCKSSRDILRKVLEKYEQKGYTFYSHPECEFFLFHTDENGMPTTMTHEQAGYLEMSPLDLGENARRDIVLTLKEMGYAVDSSHHEIAPAQHEIDFRYAKGLETADQMVTARNVIRTVAKRHGLHATFMPKPKAGVNGSGMHIHMILRKDGKNLFLDEKDPLRLSQEAYYFIGGILKNIRGITAVLNPLVNSYKRLVPGFVAPTSVGWSTKSRSALLKVTYNKEGEPRMKLQSPDASANPYLVLALALAAGMDGIENRILPGEPDSEKGSTQKLPENLKEALECMKEDKLAIQVLGEEFFLAYLSAKEMEWEEYRRQVSAWELENYLYKI